MTTYHYFSTSFAGIPTFAFVALFALVLLERLASKAAQKAARVRVTIQNRNAVRLGYRQRPRY